MALVMMSESFLMMQAPSSFTLPSRQEKPSYVQNLFTRIAKYYDLMNDVMTLGLHRLWKLQACRRLALSPSSHVLDVCCGTGDLAFTLAQLYPQASITGLDFCAEMLEIAEKRVRQKRVAAKFLQGDAMALPFEGNAFDGVVIGYGLRNVANYQACLAEMVRVVKPGGYVVVLDMSHPTGVVNWLSAVYRFKIMPWMGKFVANDPEAYRYLSNSIFFYPTQTELVDMMGQAGLSHVAYQNKMGGVCALHWGQKTHSS